MMRGVVLSGSEDKGSGGPGEDRGQHGQGRGGKKCWSARAGARAGGGSRFRLRCFGLADFAGRRVVLRVACVCAEC